MKFLSIIIPCYNIERYIEDCLNSVLNQDLRKDDYEIICVNDGSKDRTLEILSKYEETNENIVIVNQINSGVSTARNNGLEKAKGEYVWYIDGDDFINPNCLAFIKKSIQEKNADILNLQFERCNENAKFTDDIRSYELDIENKVYVANCPFTIIIKKFFLINNNIKFNTELSYAEDNLWRWYIGRIKRKQISCSNPIYMYRTRSNSAMNSKSDEARYKHIKSMILLVSIYKEENAQEILTSYATEGILMDLIGLNDKKIRDEYLEKLKGLGYYPYKRINKHLKRQTSIKDQIRCLLQYPFPNEFYYKCMYNVLKFYKR